MARGLPSLKARTRLMPLVFAVVTVALSSNADAGACGNNLSAFEWEMSSRPLPVVGAGPNFPPGREAETLLVVSSLLGWVGGDGIVTLIGFAAKSR